MAEEKGIIFYDKDFFEYSSSQDDLMKENVVRILSTRRGERLNNLSFGSDISKYIFMPEMQITDLANEVKNSIERNENRCQVVSCSFDPMENEQVNIYVTIKSKITDTVSTVSVTV